MGTLDVIVLGAPADNPCDLRDETYKAKSALLYGDQVLVRSHKVHFLLGTAAASARLMTKTAREGKIDPETLEKLIVKLEEGLSEKSPIRDLVLDTLRSDHPEMFFEFPEVVAEVLRKRGPLDGELFFRKTAATAAEGYLQASGRLETEQESLVAVEELVRLSESGTVSIDTGGAQEIWRSQLEDVEDSFRRSLQEAIEAFSVNPGDHPMLTEGADLKIREVGRPGKSSRAKANRAELAASMLADIPSFPTASVDEILDIRSRVAPQLGRFRAAVADLEEELNADVGGDDFAAEVEDLKLRRVAPELEDLKESLHDEGLGQTASRSAPYLATGVLGLGASVAIGAPELASAVAVSAGATTAIAKEIVERAKFDRARKKHRLFLLFDVERRLVKRK
jgi:hypothetical protein